MKIMCGITYLFIYFIIFDDRTVRLEMYIVQKPQLFGIIHKLVLNDAINEI
jgi:hypothetical protein